MRCWLHNWGRWEESRLRLHDEDGETSMIVSAQRRFCMRCRKKQIRRVRA